ncbi:MAG TPA: hypothetical protein DCL76_08535 [Chloroflexi bacterium]|nr:hypothetical protein [Chloroflexota bacterium]
MFNYLDSNENKDKLSSDNTNRMSSGFEPLSPFSANNKNKQTTHLPKWIINNSDNNSKHENHSTNYNFKWLDEHKNKPASNNKNYSPKSLKYNDSLSKSTQPSTENLKLTHTKTNQETSNTSRTNIANITTSNPKDILKNARNSLNNNQIDTALGHYMNLVKSSEKLNQVIDDLEKVVSDPHINNTATILQTLADAYTKSGNFEKALPLYHKALGR